MPIPDAGEEEPLCNPDSKKTPVKASAKPANTCGANDSLYITVPIIATRAGWAKKITVANPADRYSRAKKYNRPPPQ